MPVSPIGNRDFESKNDPVANAATANATALALLPENSAKYALRSSCAGGTFEGSSWGGAAPGEETDYMLVCLYRYLPDTVLGFYAILHAESIRIDVWGASSTSTIELCCCSVEEYRSTLSNIPVLLCCCCCCCCTCMHNYIHAWVSTVSYVSSGMRVPLSQSSK